VSIFNINARYLLLYKGVAGYRNYFFLETRIKISISFFFLLVGETYKSMYNVFHQKDPYYPQKFSPREQTHNV
jgi:hypothetical protein